MTLRSRGLLGAVLERRRAVYVETEGGSGRFWDAMGFITVSNNELIERSQQSRSPYRATASQEL